MSTILHTKEQGLRLHKLANLGGLVAIAGLENIETPLLLGALISLSNQLPNLSLQQIEQLKTFGLQKLYERKNEKKIYKQVPPTTPTSNKIILEIDDMKLLIKKLGGKIPPFDKDLIGELRRLMRKQS